MMDRIPKYKQNGSALLWGMVILLTLTVIGVAAARMGTIDSRIVGNEATAMMTYQTAESQLNLVRPPVDRLAPEGSLAYIKLALDDSEKHLSINNDESIIFTQDNINSEVMVDYDKQLTQCTPQEGYAMRVEMMQDLGGYDCHGFIVSARSTLPGTGARSLHAMGVMHYTPAQGNSLAN